MSTAWIIIALSLQILKSFGFLLLPLSTRLHRNRTNEIYGLLSSSALLDVALDIQMYHEIGNILSLSQVMSDKVIILTITNDAFFMVSQTHFVKCLEAGNSLCRAVFWLFIPLEQVAVAI